MTVELESEVQRMCNLGTAIESKARDEGLAEGRNEGVDLMAKLVDMLMEADRYADVKKGGCGRFLGPELSNSKTASILHRTQTL